MKSADGRITRWLLAMLATSLIVYAGGFLYGRFTKGWGPLDRWLPPPKWITRTVILNCMTMVRTTTRRLGRTSGKNEFEFKLEMK